MVRLRLRLWTLFLLLLAATLPLALITPAASLSSSPPTEEVLPGFTPARSVTQRALEERFREVPEATRAEAHHRTLTLEPHVAGSEADRRTADYVLRQFQQAGLPAELEEFQVLLPEPRRVKLEVLEPVRFSGPTPEQVPEDPASQDSRTLPGFNAYSASGEVTAEIVYANYGLPADYARLRELGVAVEGKIVLARYGESFRGVKAKVAEENRVAGLIIYSDPADDGYHAGEGDSYPHGPWRPASGVQRGSVLYIFDYPGDPTTPDGPSLPGAPRIDPAQARNLPRIPVLPISYGDAQQLFENLAGPAAPKPWQGGLPLTYHLGAGPVKVRLEVAMEERVRPVWNVVARIPGREFPEEIIVLGNHRDAWTYGGVDPSSGTTALLEMARGLGALLGEGWRPRRSLWLCSWDAEEQGLIGSTEWTEKHAAELRQKAVAYLNLDAAVSGDRFWAAAVPSLAEFLRQVADAVPDPGGGSVGERTRKRFREELRRQVVPGRPAPPTAGVEPTPIAERPFEVEPLGSGSDYTAFLDHLGIPATDFGFSGQYGVYHSIFDNHRWMKAWGDPGFHFHVAAARFYGIQVLRLAEADLLPFDYRAYGQEIERYLDGIRRKVIWLGQGEKLDFQPAEAAARRLAGAGKALRERYAWALEQGLVPPNLPRVNRILVETEGDFLLPQGLPGRPWFKHSIFAPGTYTGYAAVPLPGVHEAVDAGDFDEARRQLEALAAVLERAAERLESAP